MLTDAEREALSDVLGADFPWLGDTMDAVERIITTRERVAAATALREAADDCVNNWQPVYTEGNGSEWPNDTTARWLRTRADQYDRTATTERER